MSAAVKETWRSAPERQPTNPPTWTVTVTELLTDGTERHRIERYTKKGAAKLATTGEEP